MELPAVREAGGALCWSAQDGAWQIVQLHRGDRPARSIVQDTQAPVLVAQVFDSDVVAVEATSPKGQRWECALSPQMAREGYDAPEELIGDPEKVAEAATAWAREAGREPDAEALAAVLVAEADPFAEDLVTELMSALGFRFEGDAEPVE